MQTAEQVLEQVRKALDGVPLTAPAPEIAVRVVDMRIRLAATAAALHGTEEALRQVEETRDELLGEVNRLRIEAAGKAVAP